MKLLTYLESKNDLAKLKQAGVTQAILGHKQFSRFGTLDDQELIELAKACVKEGIAPLFEWDILMPQRDFIPLTQKIKQLPLELFHAIRVQDVGALEFVLDEYSKLKVQLILETGHHNFLAIKTWRDYIGERLDRIILSLELPHDTLKAYCQQLDVPVEFLGLGRILLFYSPRKLVTPLVDDNEKDFQSIHAAKEESIEIKGSSQESPHSGFPIIENFHGTFMFNTKDHFLLEHIPELKEMGVDTLRVDLRFGKELSLLTEISKLMRNFSSEKVATIKDLYPSKVVKGFYRVNKSDVLFNKLKNHRLQKRDESYLGDVLDVQKAQSIGIRLRSRDLSIEVGDKITFVTPEGKKKEVIVKDLYNSKWEKVLELKAPAMAFISHLGGISVRTMVYKEQKQAREHTREEREEVVF